MAGLRELSVKIDIEVCLMSCLFLCVMPVSLCHALFLCVMPVSLCHALFLCVMPCFFVSCLCLCVMPCFFVSCLVSLCRHSHWLGHTSTPVSVAHVTLTC